MSPKPVAGPSFFVYAGADRAEVGRRLTAREPGGEGPSRLVIVAGSEPELAARTERARAHLERDAPPGLGVHFRAIPLRRDVAFVYAAAGTAYPGMGVELLRRLPELAHDLAAAVPTLPQVMEPIHRAPPTPLKANEFVWTTAALSHFHTRLSRDLLGLQPHAMVGHSSGETNTLFAGGAWQDFVAMYEQTEASGLLDRQLAGTFDALARRWGRPAQWRMWNVRAPVRAVEEAIAGEARVHLAIVNTPTDCVIAGEEGAVAAAAARIGKDRCWELAYNCVCHVPEVEEVRDLWLTLHTRPVTPTPGIRYYSNAYARAYEPTPEACGQALLDQAVDRIDFSATIEAAYADGVRVFVEHGPQNGCSRWIDAILGDREHLAVALDRRDAGFDAALDATAALLAAGVELDAAALERRLATVERRAATPGRTGAAGSRYDQAPPKGVESQPMPLAPSPAQALAELGEALRSQDAHAVPPMPVAAESEHPLARLFAAHSGTHRDVIERLRDLHLQYLNAPRRSLASQQAPANGNGHGPPLPGGDGRGAPRADARVDPPAAALTRRSFDREHVAAFAAGLPYQCFGAGFELGQTHVRSPRIEDGEGRSITRVTDFEPAGGPWRRGYLRAEMNIGPGRSKNDPDPADDTVMFEAALQNMAFYLAGLGYTLKRDGWRFQPVTTDPGTIEPPRPVTVAGRDVVWEVFVEEVIDDPLPTLFADVVATVDGHEVFQGHRVGLELVPDWPLSSRPELRAPDPKPERMVTAGGVEFGYPALLAAAWGKPSDVFGESYRRFDGPRRVARLPGPPYHFVTRVVRTVGEFGRFESGAEVEVEYDAPADSWYFAENGAGTTPFAVIVEAALQPCGWLACFVGSPLQVDEDLLFRNLDGAGVMKSELRPGEAPLRTVVKLTSLSRSAGMIITSFEIESSVLDRPVYELRTVCGFFPPSAFENQAGLPTTVEQQEQLTEPCDFALDLVDHDGANSAMTTSAGSPSGRPTLRMIDRITGFWPHGGTAGQGQIRAEKDIDAGDWFFKAHFFQDPVQPGSLGLEAMLQLLEWYMVHTGLTDILDNPRFEPIALNVHHNWKYRGQVVPSDRLITITIDITAVSHDDRFAEASGDGSLWIDGKRIYETTGMTMRARSTPA